MKQSLQLVQGDVFFLRIENSDKNFRRLPKEGFVVAEGEITGHKHRVVEAPDSIVEIAEDANGFYLNVVKGTAQMTHQEHDTITLTPGQYQIIKQVEYDEVEELRRVMD